jgi:hypothetical protein
MERDGGRQTEAETRANYVSIIRASYPSPLFTGGWEYRAAQLLLLAQLPLAAERNQRLDQQAESGLRAVAQRR